jgi:hypothetical protein
MSLKAFHLVFLVASVLLAFGFGAWSLRQYAATSGALELAFGLGSLLAGLALLAYLRYFLKKLKDISYL